MTYGYVLLIEMYDILKSIDIGIDCWSYDDQAADDLLPFVRFFVLILLTLPEN